jgi:hypothetical protein
MVCLLKLCFLSGIRHLLGDFGDGFVVEFAACFGAEFFVFAPLLWG